jgi:hypothetical protein
MREPATAVTAVDELPTLTSDPEIVVTESGLPTVTTGAIIEIPAGVIDIEDVP